MELVINSPSTSSYNDIKEKVPEWFQSVPTLQNELRTVILPAAIENHTLNVEVDDSGAITNPLSIECIRNKLMQWNRYINPQGSCYPINNDADAVIANNQQNQRLLVSLNRHPESLRIFHLALKCKDTDELEDFNFGKVPVTASDQERCLLRTIRHTLQDFVSKFRRKSPIIPSNHERTFFFDRVMPIINYFTDNSGTVHFEWGEKVIMSLQAVTLSVAFSEISNPNYVDGIGYSTTTGVVDEERIVVECSSGGREENIQHTYGDSLKLTKSLTAMLVLKSYKRSNASYKTFCKFKTIGIQCIKRTLTLFILFMDEEKKLVVEEKRSANVPICFDEIFDFMQVFGLIAYLQCWCWSKSKLIKYYDQNIQQ